MSMKYALCIGINNYPDPQDSLSGCVNDAIDWAELLVSEGYDVTVLLDSQATRQNVVARLDRIIETARWSDRIVLTYSGHGTWLPDRNGDEVDGRDEALCLHDYALGGFLLDDDLHAMFSAVRYGVGTLILSDSCHSGTVSRFAGVPDKPRLVARFISPVEFTDLPIDRAAALEEVPARQPRRTASLISGCGDLEFSYDAWFAGRANGAFTRAAIDAYQPGMSPARWHRAIRDRLPSAQYPQTPQLSATAYRRYTRAL